LGLDETALRGGEQEQKSNEKMRLKFTDKLMVGIAVAGLLAGCQGMYEGRSREASALYPDQALSCCPSELQ
jgi:hypothetical protein